MFFLRYHGSYNAVYGGQPGDAFLALTGGVAERIDFEESDEKPRKLYSRIRNAINSGALVTCTVPVSVCFQFLSVTLIVRGGLAVIWGGRGEEGGGRWGGGEGAGLVGWVGRCL